MVQGTAWRSSPHSMVSVMALEALARLTSIDTQACPGRAASRHPFTTASSSFVDTWVTGWSRRGEETNNSTRPSSKLAHHDGGSTCH